METKEAIVAIVASLVAGAVLLSPVAWTMQRHKRIEEAIKAGADPIEAKCAIESENTQEPVCVLAAQRSRK